MNTNSPIQPVALHDLEKTPPVELEARSPEQADTALHLTAEQRERVLIDAEGEILERLCGVAKNVVTLTEQRLRKLRLAAGMSPSDEGERYTDQPERHAARHITAKMHKWLSQYPDVWDEQALPVGTERDYELHAALRRRVRQMVTKIWCSND